jgi:hypothetical protein
MDKRLLAIYLADHHAGAVAGFELARRAARSNRGTPTGAVLAEVAAEIAADRRTLERLMDAHGVRPSRVKVTLARAAELAGRLKPNGRLLRYSPLSRVAELEMLSLGILGKLKLWQACATVPPVAEISGLDFDALTERAEAQHAAIEACRRQAADVAFG